MSLQSEIGAREQVGGDIPDPEGSRTRSRSVAGRAQVRVGMPHLGLSGLSENWLLRECGDRHWQAVCDAVGVPSHQLRNRAGHRLYSSFIATEISGDPLGAFAENDTLSFAIRVTRLSPYRFFSSQHVVCPSRGIGCTVNMVTMFVKKETFEDNYGLSREAVPILHVQESGVAEPTDVSAAERLQLAHRHLKDVPPACPSSEYVYDICPLTDFNAARFLYFAGYQMILDRAEWHLLRQPGLEFGSTVHRRIYYFANINIGDRALVRIGGVQQDGANYRFNAVLMRSSDGRMIACAESVRTLCLFGDTATQAANGLDGRAGCGPASGQPTHVDGSLGDHDDMPAPLAGRGGCQPRFVNLLE
jgi:probable biosynthetic protein (TIGR04098 family)